MTARSALAGLATGVALAAALGSPAAQHAAADARNVTLGRTLTAFPSWDVSGASADVVWSYVIRLGVMALATAGLCALAGNGGSRRTGFLAGWAAGVVAAGVAGAVAFAYLDATVYAHVRLEGTYIDRMVAAVNSGATYGLWTGWLIGAAVAFAIWPAAEAARRGAEDHTEAWDQPVRIDDPPPPWWAPTEVVGEHGESQVRPGPSVFLPGGAPPVVAGLGDRGTGVMRTASGDPHPSDPDATQAIGLPRADDEDDTEEASGVPDASHERAAPPEATEEATTEATTNGADPDDETVEAPAAEPEPDTTAVVAAADDTDPTAESPAES